MNLWRLAPLWALAGTLVLVSILAWRLGGAREARAATAAPAPQIANPHGSLKVECEACHTAESWKSIRKPMRFDHATTGFPLAGQHASAACEQCHKSPVFSRVATSCVDCHRDVHEGRKGTSCQDCHSSERWTARSDAVRQHASAGFPLRGVHALLECSRCHGGTGEKNVAKLSSDCVSCHAAQYAAARSPNHAAAGYSTRCETCHDASRMAWTGSGFDHAATGFPLTGAHRAAACQQCHSGGSPTHVSPECYACHQTQFANTRNPNHQSAGFGTQCATCHTTSSWAGANFDHNRTRFALTGAHQAAACTGCHAGGRFAGTPMDCNSCHQAQYAATTNPNHAAAGFPTDCTRCHSTTNWSGATFDHNTTSFPLTGTHRTTACTGCHAGGRFAGTPTTCYSCHQAQYAATTNPNHAAAGFPTDCTRCHSTTNWSGATFDHNTTRFALTGAHRTTACTGCHAGNRYAGTPMDCNSCHQAQYAATTNPNHQAAGFSTVCASCHTTNAWQPANFNHDQFFRTSSGNHNVSCVTCHQNSASYASFTCFQCHTHNQATTDAQHQGRTGYRYDSSACYSCHKR
jgi:hypothetical protein